MLVAQLDSVLQTKLLYTHMNIHVSSTGKKILLISSLLLAITFITIFIYVAITFSRIYQAETQYIPEAPRQLEYIKPDFQIKTITIKDLNSGCSIKILQNGTATQYCGDNQQLFDRKILSSDLIQRLFSNLNEDQFSSLLSDYFSFTLHLQIIIETSIGSKTININSSSSNQPSGNFQDFLDDIEDVTQETNQPTPPPPPTPPPTSPPPPSPSSHPNPTPSTSPTPYPTPFPREGTAQPSFDCSIITETGVTVSNVRCLDPNQGLPPN